jgi:predicted aldo/keto reductase-like oxidoreductase
LRNVVWKEKKRREKLLFLGKLKKTKANLEFCARFLLSQQQPETILWGMQTKLAENQPGGKKRVFKSLTIKSKKQTKQLQSSLKQTNSFTFGIFLWYLPL